MYSVPQADGLPSDFVGNCNVSECRSATLAANTHQTPTAVISKGQDPLTWVPLLAAIPLLLSAALISATACYILLNAPMFTHMAGTNSKMQASPGDSQSQIALQGKHAQSSSAVAASKGIAMTWKQAGPVGEAVEVNHKHGNSAAAISFEFRDITLSVPVSSKVAQSAMSHAALLATEANTTAAAEAAALGDSEISFQPATSATFCAIITTPSRRAMKASVQKTLSGVGLTSDMREDKSGRRQRSSSSGGLDAQDGSGLDLESAESGTITKQRGGSYRKVLLRGVSAHAHAGEVLGLLVSPDTGTNFQIY